jgi:integrase
MTNSKKLARQVGLGLLAAGLLGAVAFVMLRSGPLAPVRITVAKVGMGSLAFRRTLERARAAYEKDCGRTAVKPSPSFLADLRLHDFRHHAVSSWAATGALSVVELMAISGHKSPRMLARYTHLSASSLAGKLATLQAS